MTRQSEASVQPPSPEERRVAVGQFERANQVLATGNHDYGTQLLLNCCKLDPEYSLPQGAVVEPRKSSTRTTSRGASFPS